MRGKYIKIDGKTKMAEGWVYVHFSTGDLLRTPYQKHTFYTERPAKQNKQSMEYSYKKPLKVMKAYLIMEDEQ